MKTAIVSCPECFRQYRIDPLEVKVGMCGSCKSQFAIVFARLSEGGEDPVMLDQPIEPGHTFFQGACAELAINARDLLRLANEPVTRRALCRLVKTMPRSPSHLSCETWRQGDCNQFLKRIYESPSKSTHAFEVVFDYFTVHIPSRTFVALDMLEAAFVGILESIELDEKPPQKVPPKKRRFAWLRFGRAS